MNTDTIHDRLTAEAHGASLHETGLDEVRRRAGRIRRRRNAATLAGVALAVVAVVVPAGVLGEQVTSAPQRPEPAGPTRGPSTKPVDVTEPASLAGVPAGARPALPYALGTTLHLADGSSVDAARAGSLSSWTPYADGYLAYSDDTVSRYRDDGTLLESWTPGSPLRISPDGRRVAWVGSSDVLVSAPDGSARRTYDLPFAISVAGFGSDGSLVVNDEEGVLVLRSDTRRTPLPARLAYATGAEPASGLVAARTRKGQHSVVVDPTGRTLWRDDARDVGQFSADGRLVWATGPVGIRPDRVDLLDARSGSVVASLDLGRAGGRVRHVSWEDDGHVLVVVSDARTRQATVLRLGRDGSLDRALPLRSTDLPGAYLFAADGSR